MRKTINEMLKSEGKRLCPKCGEVTKLNKSECTECKADLPKTSTPEDGLF